MKKRRDGEQHEVAEHVRQLTEERLHEGDVAVGPGDELARLHVVVAREVKALQMVVDGVAQVVLHVEADAAAAEPPEVSGARARQTREEQQR